jgi:hypothetical protein
MADIKQASFMVLIILVSVSGVFEWAKTDEVLSQQPIISNPDELSYSELLAIILNINIPGENEVQTESTTDLWILNVPVIGEGLGIATLLYKMFFGWNELLTGIFGYMGLAGLSLVFVVPLAIIELLGIFYLLSDIKRALPFIG